MDGGTTLIAIDWGTTHARAWRVGPGGEILGARSAPLGVQKVAGGDFPGALATLLGDWIALPVPRLACGMIGSRQGWLEAPYVPCPASLTALAGALATTPRRELTIVPGLLAEDADGIPDVMRGEETQVAGAVDALEHRVLAVLPGTHSKWVQVDDGRLVTFQTHMTGELYAVMLEHSILGRLAAPAGSPSPGPAFARGVARGLETGALSHLMFGARTLALTGALAPPEVPDWLSGLLIGREIRQARTWAFHAGLDAARVRVIGEDALVERYRAALTQAGIVAEAGPAAAAVRGLRRIARVAGLVP